MSEAAQRYLVRDPGPDDDSGLDHDAISTKSKDVSTCQDSSIHRSEKADETDDAAVGKQSAAPRNYLWWQWASILAAIYSSQFLYGLDVTIVADIQGAVTDDFGDVGLLGWLGIGFPLGSVATILPLGKAYSTFDIKWLYIGSMIMFTAGSALCGGAPDMKSLIIGRVWAGAGGAGMFLGVLNLITANTSIRERPVYVAASGVVWGAGCILGPIIGGSFADSSATWRWAFYLNLVLFGLFSPVLFFVLRPFSFQPYVSFALKVYTMDWIGITLNAALWTVFVMLFTFAGSQWAWDDYRTIILFVMLGVILLAFAASQYFTILTTKENRIFPCEFLCNKTLVLLYICQACAATTLFIPIYYIPIFFQFVHGDSGVQAAVRLLPFICIGVCANMFQGAMMPKSGRYMPWFFAASMFSIIAGVLFYATVDVDTPASRIYGYSVLLALGAGLSQMASYSVAPTEVALHRVPDAVGFMNMAQIGSSVIALTIGSSIFQTVGFRHVAAALSGLGFLDAEIKEALSGRRSTVFMQVSDEVRQKLIKAIVLTVNEEYILVITAGTVGLVVASMMNRGKLRMEMAAGG